MVINSNRLQFEYQIPTNAIPNIVMHPQNLSSRLQKHYLQTPNISINQQGVAHYGKQIIDLQLQKIIITLPKICTDMIEFSSVS